MPSTRSIPFKITTVISTVTIQLLCWRVGEVLCCLLQLLSRRWPFFLVCSLLFSCEDPLSMSPQKAMEQIKNNLQKQYERWQPRARYKQMLDPTTEEVRKLCLALRKTAKVCSRLACLFVCLPVRFSVLSEFDLCYKWLWRGWACYELTNFIADVWQIVLCSWLELIITSLFLVENVRCGFADSKKCMLMFLSVIRAARSNCVCTSNIRFVTSPF